MVTNPLFQAFLDVHPIYENDVTNVSVGAYDSWISELKRLFKEVHPNHMFDGYRIYNYDAWYAWIINHEYRKYLKSDEKDYHCPWK